MANSASWLDCRPVVTPEADTDSTAAITELARSRSVTVSLPVPLRAALDSVSAMAA
jgi:hypothetical protein